jgi:hypothetical protein
MRLSWKPRQIARYQQDEDISFNSLRCSNSATFDQYMLYKKATPTSTITRLPLYVMLHSEYLLVPNSSVAPERGRRRSRDTRQRRSR